MGTDTRPSVIEAGQGPEPPPSRATASPVGRGRRSFPWFASFVFLALALLYAGPALLPGRILVPLDGLSDLGAWKGDPTRRSPVSNNLLSDVLFQYVPWDVAIQRQIRSGSFPWVNPYAGRGRPLWANPLPAPLSPFTWPRLLFGLRGWAIDVLLKLLVAGLGAYALARKLSASRREAVVSGAIYMTGGFTIVWALYPQTNVAVLLPALLASLLALRRDLRPARAAAVVALAAATTAGGHPETLALGACGVVTFLIWDAAAERTFRRNATAMAVSLGALAAGFLLDAVQIVPFLRLLPEAEMTAHRAITVGSHIRWPAIAAQILPGAFGSPLRNEIDLTGALAMTRGSAENFNWRASTYVGALGLAVLLLVGRNLGPRFRRARLAGFAALAIVWRLPFLATALHRVPLIGLAVPEWWGAVAAMFLAVSVGPAVGSLAASRHPRLGVAFGSAGLLLVAAGSVPSLKLAEPMVRHAVERRVQALKESGYLKLPPRIYEERMTGYIARVRWTALRRVALPGLGFLLFALGLLARRRRGTILAASVLAELLAFGLGLNPAIPLSAAPATPETIAFLTKSPFRETSFIAAAPGVYPPNLATRDGLRDIRSYDALESQSEIARLRECGFSEGENAFLDSPTATQVQCLSRLGVRYFLTRENVSGVPQVAGGPPPKVAVYEFKQAASVPFPRDDPPPGLTVGGVLSVFGLALGIGMSVIARRRRTGPWRPQA